MKVLNKKDYEGQKAFYDEREKAAKVEQKTVEEVAAAAAADGVVTMEELKEIAKAKKGLANALPLPEDTKPEVEAKRREEVLAKRDEIKPVKIDTPLGAGPIVDEEQPSPEAIEKLKKDVAKKKAAKKTAKAPAKKRGRPKKT